MADHGDRGWPERLEAAEKILGHRFSDRELLRRALTHPSAVADSATQSFERLEFLGDSIIGAMVAEEVYRRFPQMPEGGMTRIRISVIAGPVLATVSQDVGLEELIVYGESELRSGRRGRASALEDVYEAVSAALYLDAGVESARRWVLSTLGPLIDEDVAASPANPKSVLQEAVQARGQTVAYRILGHEGPPHERSFTAVVEVDGTVAGEGTGRSKREAEVAAATEALRSISGLL